MKTSQPSPVKYLREVDALMTKPSVMRTWTKALEGFIMMIRYLFEGLAAVALIGMVSILGGLLRSAKSSSQVTEQQDRLTANEDQHLEIRPGRKGRVSLQTAS